MTEPQRIVVSGSPSGISESIPQDNNQPAKELLKFRHICKSFPGVKALDDINIDLDPGEVHILVGENGAGKSTLMKVLSGACDFGRPVL